DVVVVHTTQPRDGMLSLGIEVNILPAAIEEARARGALVVAQLNPRMPFTYGDALVPTADIDLAVEVDVAPGVLPSRAPSETQRQVGLNVASLVPDGATL